MLGHNGLTFSSAGFVGPVGSDLEMTIGYSVWTVSGKELINGIGQRISGTGQGYIALDETVFGTGDPGAGQLGFSHLSLGDLIDPPAEALDFLSFAPQSKVSILKDFALGTGIDSAGNRLACLETQDCIQVRGTSLQQWVTQTSDVPEVPEPATMLLFSTALLGLGFMRRKKS